MERFDNMGATIYTYPGFVPGIISSVIVLLGLIMIIRGLKSKVGLDANAKALINRRSCLPMKRLL